MKLYMVQCGYHDQNLFEGTFKTHISFFVAGKDFNEARCKAMQMPEFRGKQMEIDSIHELEAVNGCRIFLAEDKSLSNKTIVHSMSQRDRTLKGAPRAQTLESQPLAN